MHGGFYSVAERICDASANILFVEVPNKADAAQVRSGFSPVTRGPNMGTSTPNTQAYGPSAPCVKTYTHALVLPLHIPPPPLKSSTKARSAMWSFEQQTAPISSSRSMPDVRIGLLRGSVSERRLEGRERHTRAEGGTRSHALGGGLALRRLTANLGRARVDFAGWGAGS